MRPETTAGVESAAASTRCSKSTSSSFGLDPADTCVYACGHPQMIEDVKVRGENAGFHVEEERFWKEDD